MNDARLARAWLGMTPTERPPGEWRCGRCHDTTEIYDAGHEPKSVCCDSPYLRFEPARQALAEVRVHGEVISAPLVPPTRVKLHFAAMHAIVAAAPD